MKSLERSVRPMMSYRSVRPPQKQIAQEIDAEQREMIAIVCPSRRGPGVDSSQYAKSNGRQASDLAKNAVILSHHWFRRASA